MDPLEQRADEILGKYAQAFHVKMQSQLLPYELAAIKTFLLWFFKIYLPQQKTVSGSSTPR